MPKKPMGAKRCAFKGCKAVFTAIGRRAYCDEHRPGGAKQGPDADALRRAYDRLIQAAWSLGDSRAEIVVNDATAEVVRRNLDLRCQLIKSRHEVQKLKAKVDERKIAKSEKLGVEDLPEQEAAE